jgi:hypothetical protein
MKAETMVERFMITVPSQDLVYVHHPSYQALRQVSNSFNVRTAVVYVARHWNSAVAWGESTNSAGTPTGTPAGPRCIVEF